MRCPRCGTLQFSGQRQCRACAAPLAGAGATTWPIGSRARAHRRRLSIVALAAIAFLLLVCLTLIVATIGLTAVIRFA